MHIPALSNLAAYGKSLHAALLVQMREQKAADLMGFCRLFMSSSAVQWMHSMAQHTARRRVHSADLYALPAHKSLPARLVPQHYLQLMKLCHLSAALRTSQAKPIAAGGVCLLAFCHPFFFFFLATVPTIAKATRS